MGRGRGGWER
jgi:hypothetical protein